MKAADRCEEQTFAASLLCAAAVALCAAGTASAVGAETRGEPGLQIEERQGVNPWNHLRMNGEPENFQFAIISDVTGRLRPNVFPDAIRKLNLLQPEFVMTIGDLIEGHTNDSAQLNREWDQFFKAIQGLQMPIFYVPGNHDYWYRTAQNPDGKTEVYDMAAVYKQRVGRSYYHFVYRNVLFLILNNSMGDAAEFEEQKHYVTETLRRYKDVRWTFTFFHYDFFEQGDLWKHMEPLLADRPFTAFSGNSHNYMKYVDGNGRELIRLATTGGMSRVRGPAFGEMDHIVWVTMTDSGPKLGNLLLDGIYDANVRTQQSAKMANLLLEGTAGSGPPVRSEVIRVQGKRFNGATTQLHFTNAGGLPLHIRGSFEPNDRLRPEPAFFTLEVPGNSSMDLPLSLSVHQAVAVDDIKPLILDWQAAYTLPGDDPDVRVSGTHRILIDRAGERPAPDWTVIHEPFSGNLDPAWVPLGAGGTFNAQGQYLLVDDPPELEGERKDSAGRYISGPLYETAVHTPMPEGVYRYTDGRGIYTLTPGWQLPVAGLYRDIPPDSFEAELRVSEIRWDGDTPDLHWEFWDSPDQIYNYGPSYLSGVIVQLSRESGTPVLALRTFRKTGYRPAEREYRYTDLGKVELAAPPSSLSLRARWRESTRTWSFFYGINGGDALAPIPGGDFLEDIRPSPDGKRNLIYVRAASQESGFSVVLDNYRLLH